MLWTKSLSSSKLRRLRKNGINDREVQFVDYEVQNHTRYINETREQFDDLTKLKSTQPA